MYIAKFTDTGSKTKVITRNTFGAGQELLFSITDENGAAINLSTLTTSMLIYIGTEGTLIVTGGTVADATSASGLVKYEIQSTDFNAESDVGIHNIELQFSDNATLGSATKIIRVGGMSLTVIDTIVD